jgi:hypothetical protein
VRRSILGVRVVLVAGALASAPSALPSSAPACRAAIPSQVGAPAADLEALLARGREALALSPDDPVLETSGLRIEGRERAPFAWILGPDGAFLMERRGPSPSRVVSDGEAAWRLDGDGPAWRIGGLEAERQRLLAHAWSGAWARPRSPLERLAGPGPEELSLRVPGGRVAAVLRLEAGRPRSLAFPEAAGGDRFRFEGSLTPAPDPLRADSAREGPRLPARVLHERPGRPSVVHELADARVWRGGAPPFGRPADGARRQGLDPQRPPAIEVVRGAGGDLRLACELGTANLLLRFDPACPELTLRPGIADGLGLPRGADPLLRGSADPLRIGPLQRAHPRLRLAEGEPDAREQVDGWIGWELLTAGTLLLRREPLALELVSGAPPPEPAGLTWIPLELDERRPFVVAATPEGDALRLALVAPGEPSGHHLPGDGPRRVRLGGRTLELSALPRPSGSPRALVDGRVALDQLGPLVALEALGRGLGVVPDGAPDDVERGSPR